jgi:hypothetical protein
MNATVSEMRLNVVVERLALLFRIQKVPGLNLGPETGHPDWCSSWISSAPPDKYRDEILN